MTKEELDKANELTREISGTSDELKQLDTLHTDHHLDGLDRTIYRRSVGLPDELAVLIKAMVKQYYEDRLKKLTEELESL